jgi:hypothetical protein
LRRASIEDAQRRHRILKELVRRERTYTRGYLDLDRLYDIGVLEKGTPGDAREVAQRTLDDLDNAVDLLGLLDITASFESMALERIATLAATVRGSLRRSAEQGDVPPGAPDLVRDPSGYADSLKLILEFVAFGADPASAEQIEEIRSRPQCDSPRALA